MNKKQKLQKIISDIEGLPDDFFKQMIDNIPPLIDDDIVLEDFISLFNNEYKHIFKVDSLNVNDLSLTLNSQGDLNDMKLNNIDLCNVDNGLINKAA